MSDVEETLAREAEGRPRAGAAAIAAGALTLIGNILLTLLTRGGPSEGDGFISISESISMRLQGQGPQEESLLVKQVDYFGDKVLPLSLSTILTTLAAALAAYALVFIYRATAARVPETTRPGLIAAIAGGALFAVGHLVREIGTWAGASGFDGTTAESARDVFRDPVVAAAGLLEVLGSFGLALAFVLISLAAMRAGLLTRFMGILGVIVGALSVFQLDQPQIVRAFWLVMLGLIILRRNPGTPLPAWETGRAVPWPSQQQLAEARRAAQPDPEPSTDDDGNAENGAAQRPVKRKRKRRR